MQDLASEKANACISKPTISGSTVTGISQSKEDKECDKSQAVTTGKPDQGNKVVALPSWRERSQGDQEGYEPINLPTHSTKIKSRKVDSISNASQTSLSTDDRKPAQNEVRKEPTKIKKAKVKSKRVSNSQVVANPNGKIDKSQIKDAQQILEKNDKLPQNKIVQLRIRQAKTVISLVNIIVCFIIFGAAGYLIYRFMQCPDNDGNSTCPPCYNYTTTDSVL